MSDYYSIPNWEDLQHYKDRTPPWIKLHNELLENYDFECLPDASKAHLLCIWLLASRTNNKIKADAKWIERRICANDPVDLNLLVAKGFLQLNQELQSVEQDASKALHKKEQDACLEREGEKRESRAEQSKEDVDFDPFENLGFDYQQIKDIKQIRKDNKGGKITQRVVTTLAKEFEKALESGMSQESILDEWASRGWKSFKFDWTDASKGAGQTRGLPYSGFTAGNINTLQNFNPED